MASRVLIVDDVPTNRIILKTRLAAAFYEVEQADSGAEALRLMAERPADIVLLDYVMPGLDGIEVCRALRADPRSAAVPVIMVTASADHEARLAALRAGADDFLTKPVDDAVLLARMRNLLRARGHAGRIAEFDRLDSGFAEPAATFEETARIGLIAPDAAAARHWSATLAPHLQATFLSLPPAAAMDGTGPVPDLYLVALDLDRPGAGMELVSELRARPATSDAGICVVAPAGAAGAMAASLDLGADEVFADHFSGAEVAIRARALIARKRARALAAARMTEHLRLAWIDPLTTLHNRRYGLPALRRMLDEATGPTSVMVLDLDRFKAINDQHGHSVGDRVLSEVATRLRAALSEADLAVRLGGEEFLIASTRPATLPEAEALAHRLRRAVAGQPFALGGGLVQGVTVSVGLTFVPQRSESAEGAIDLADAALLRAKALGRNTVRNNGRTVA